MTHASSSNPQAPAVRAALLAVVPLQFLLWSRLHQQVWTPEGPGGLLLASSVLLLLGVMGPRWTRAAALLAPMILGYALFPTLLHRPLSSLGLLLVATVWVERIFAWTHPAPTETPVSSLEESTRAELKIWALATGAALSLALTHQGVRHPGNWAAVVVICFFAFRSAGKVLEALHPDWRRFTFLIALIWWAVAVALGFRLGPRASLVFLCLGPWLPLVLPTNAPGSDLRRFAEGVLTHPAQLLVTTFLGLCLLGGLLLSFEVSHRSVELSILDALFTAVSAVCVTGLIVVDTPLAFSGLGQIFILLLIQVGGLGIMTFSSGALVLLGRRLSLRHEATFANLLGDQDRGHLVSVVGRTLGVTFGFELAGTVVLAAAFYASGEALGPAAWRALFTSISAFCNAGFALQSDSLIPYQTNAVVLHVVGILIIAGGLSPLVVWLSITGLWRRRLQQKLVVSAVLVSTAFLLVTSFFAFLGMEWDSSLRGLGFADRLHNAWFQAVTLRTAGFNSIDFAETRASTQTIMILMMFIGGAPGGTAGGIKVTTAFILLLAVWSTMRGRTSIAAFGRTIPQATVARAAAIATLGLASNFMVYVALQLTQAIDSPLILFETVSASSTVGLSLGATSRLDDVGKLIIMFAMFVGRVGPLTTFLFLADRVVGATWNFPEENLDVG